MLVNYLTNLKALIRPLSNLKTAAIIILALYLSGARLEFIHILGTLSLFLACYFMYTFNTYSDFAIDKKNKNKKHYSASVSFFSKKTVLKIGIFLFCASIIIGAFVNVLFLTSILFLLISSLLYSAKKTRYKERFVLDILFGATLSFAFRFMAAWFMFSATIPPLLPILMLIFLKSGGFILYKSLDREELVKLKIKNTFTVLSTKKLYIISSILLLLAYISFLIMATNKKYLGLDFLGYLPFSLIKFSPLLIIPLVFTYARLFKRINIPFKLLRLLGFIYLAIIIVIIWWKI